jgi:hypothetical protein
MRVTIDGVRHHKCDWCRNDFTASGEAHLTISVGERSGVASLASPLPGWRFDSMLVSTQLHFCLPTPSTDAPGCLDKWIRAVIHSEAPMPEYRR